MDRPLIERLRSVPREVLVSRFDGAECQAGVWCHEAAEALEHLQADEAALSELLDDARTALSVLQPSCLADEELKEETLAAIDAARSK